MLMNDLLTKKTKIWITVVFSMIVPGSGHVFLGRPIRGLIMVMWMFAFGYITFKLTTAGISLTGRLSGGFAVLAISVLEVHRLAKKRWAVT